MLTYNYHIVWVFFFKNSKICLPLSFPPRSEIKNKKVYGIIASPEIEIYDCYNRRAHTGIHYLDLFGGTTSTIARVNCNRRAI